MEIDLALSFMKTALLIIDVQQALCSGTWAAFDIENVVGRINKLSSRLREAGAPIIVIQHEEESGPLQYGTEGWRLFEELEVRPEDFRVRKTACDSFHKTALHVLLQSHQISHLIVCGLQSEFCIDSTVRGALAHGYAVALVSDGHSTVDNGVLTAAQISAHHNATLANICSFDPTVNVSTAEHLTQIFH